MIRNKLTGFLNRFTNSYKKISYSQCGEDLILEFLLNDLGISTPTYIDIGTNDPIHFNNTYFFYRKGARGICIEPDPVLCKQIRKKRAKDICLNVGIGVSEENENMAKFYIMTSNTLNTFSERRAQGYIRDGCYGTQKIEKIIEIPVMSINTVISKYFTVPPNLISLDVEGWELQILNNFDFNSSRPEVFCIETAFFAEDKTVQKHSEINNFMVSKNYFLYADTFINSIFVDKKSWNSRNDVNG